MKVILTHDYKWKSLDFCCPEMGEQIMAHTIRPDSFSDHQPRFYFCIEGWSSYITYCPYCGAKIEGRYEDTEK